MLACSLAVYARMLTAPPRCTARRCEIHIFDPTLTAEQNKLMKSLPGITFHAYGLGAMDGEVRGVAHRKTALQKTADALYREQCVRVAG